MTPTTFTTKEAQLEALNEWAAQCKTNGDLSGFLSCLYEIRQLQASPTVAAPLVSPSPMAPTFPDDMEGKTDEQTMWAARRAYCGEQLRKAIAKNATLASQNIGPADYVPPGVVTMTGLPDAVNAELSDGDPSIVPAEGSVTHELCRLDGALQALHDILPCLERELASVLTPPNTNVSAQGSTGTVEPERSEVAQRICEATTAVNSATNFLRELGWRVKLG